MKVIELINEVVIHNKDYKQFRDKMDNIRGNRLKTIEGKISKTQKNKESFLQNTQVNLLSKAALDFIDYFTKIVEKYSKIEKEVKVPLSAIPGVAAMVATDTINKLDLKLLNGYLKENPKAGRKEAINFLLAIGKPEVYNHYISKIELDKKDMEDFINKISKDPGVKTKLKNLDNRLNRFAELLAKEKYLY